MKRFLPIILSLSAVLILIFYLSFRIFDVFKPFLPFTNYLLGADKPISYLVLLGNDAEIRANGGFAGSYAKITLSSPSPLSKGETAEPRGISVICHLSPVICNLKFDLSFQDIYVPNGQIKGLFVAPPWPIQQAFGHGTWELANADWEPDFPTAAKQLRWFMEKGHEINPDILAILNLSTIKKVLNVVGSFSVPEYQATLTPDNLYQFLQGKVELNFFPGSTQKRDTLTAVGNALFKRFKALSLPKKIQIAHILYSDFKNQNLLINSTNLDFQSFLENQKLAGIFQPEAMDTYSMIETNLGANKANAYVTRQTTHEITFSSTQANKGVTLANAGIYTNNSINHKVTVKFTNSSPEANPNPPFDYGGNYNAYLRLYIPENAQNITLTRSPEGKPPLDLPSSPPDPLVSPKYGLTELGFWHTTQAGNESTISLSYDLPLVDQVTYTLAILKQHGLPTSPQNITLFGQPIATDLTQSFYYP